MAGSGSEVLRTLSVEQRSHVVRAWEAFLGIPEHSREQRGEVGREYIQDKSPSCQDSKPDRLRDMEEVDQFLLFHWLLPFLKVYLSSSTVSIALSRHSVLALLSVLIKHDYLRSLFLTYFDDWWLSFSFFSFKRSFCYFFIWLSEPTLVPRPWSSGYERRLMTQRLCVRILVPVSRWIYFSQLLFVKLNCLKDRKNKKMQRMDHFYKKILIDVFVEY